LSFSLELAANSATVVWGDGNIGKTLIFSRLKEAAMKRKIKGTYVFINMQSINNVDLLANAVDALFVIDDFDIVRMVRPEIVTYLNQFRNQALVFGRMLDDLYVDKHYLYNAKQDGNTILFSPVLDHHLN
jgi:GTPase SAR1 family protein